MKLNVRTLAATLFALSLAVGAPGQAAGSGDPDATVLEGLFAGRTVLHIDIEIPPEGIRTLSGGWGGNRRPSTKATIREGGRVYTNVAIHIKGGVGSFRPINADPAFTLNFEKNAPGQTFHGLKKLSLNNSVQDPTFLNDFICRDLFIRAGSPTPRAGFTTVKLNGRDLGVHVLTEGFNKQFLRHYFDNVHGNLYQTHGNQEITDHLDVNSGDDPKNDSGLRALAKAVDEPDPATRWRRLNETLDMDRFLSFMSMEIMLCHWDGYCMNQNNYRVFHDLGANKIVFIAHGMDQMFGIGTMLLGGDKSTADAPLFPPWHGAVADALMSTPEGRRLYIARLGQLYTNLFQVDVLLKRVDELSSVVRTALTESGSARVRTYQRHVDELKAHLVERDKSIAQQLALLSKPRVASASGPIQLSGWTMKAQEGQPVLTRGTVDSRPNVLHVLGGHGGSAGSWRTRIQLGPGRYRFQGQVRVQSVTPQEDDYGAGLRISGARRKHLLTGNTDWQPFSYEFEVGSPRQVELVCELRAIEGEAWFDKLQLVRVE